MDDLKCYLKGGLMVIASLSMLLILHAFAESGSTQDVQSALPTLDQNEQCETAVRPVSPKENLVWETFEYEDEEEPEAITEAETEIPEPIAEPEHFYNIPLSHEFQHYVRETAKSFGFEAELLFAIMEEESLFRANAVSPSDDWGLCQVNRVCFDWLREHYGVTNLLDPYQNVIAGCAILKWTSQFTETDSLEELLLYYGCGVGRGRKLWQQGVKRLTFGERMLSILDAYKNGERD